MFESQKSGNKTSSAEIGLEIRTHASPKVGQDQVSGGVSVLCWHRLQMFYGNLTQLGKKVKFGNKVQISKGSKISVMSHRWRVSCNIRERGTSY